MKWLALICSYTEGELAQYSQRYHQASHIWPQEFSYEVTVAKDDRCSAVEHKTDRKRGKKKKVNWGESSDTYKVAQVQ